MPNDGTTPARRPEHPSLATEPGSSTGNCHQVTDKPERASAPGAAPLAGGRAGRHRASRPMVPNLAICVPPSATAVRNEEARARCVPDRAASHRQSRPLTDKSQRVACANAVRGTGSRSLQAGLSANRMLAHAAPGAQCRAGDLAEVRVSFVRPSQRTPLRLVARPPMLHLGAALCGVAAEQSRRLLGLLVRVGDDLSEVEADRQSRLARFLS